MGQSELGEAVRELVKTNDSAISSPAAVDGPARRIAMRPLSPFNSRRRNSQFRRLGAQAHFP